MANKNFKVRHGLDVGDGLSITDSATFTTVSNGNITLAPNGTGDIVLTLANGGNLTNTRNYLFGPIRNITTESAGDIWAVNSTGPVSPYRGVSLDNSSDTNIGPGTLMRAYSGGAVSGARGRLIFEKARGTAVSPSRNVAGDILGSIEATGYTTTGWVNDNIAGASPFLVTVACAESWTSNTNLGTVFTISQAPTATTFTGATEYIATLSLTPQQSVLRADRFAISQGKTIGFTATGCSTSGTTLTIGTLVTGTVAVGQVLTASGNLNFQYIVANISGSGSGSTWRLGGSPGTLTGQSISGSAGMIGSVPATSNSIDMLKPLRLITPIISNAVTSDSTQIYNYATKIAYASTENTLGNMLTLKPGQLAGSTSYDKQTEISVVQNTTDGSNFASFEVKTQRFNGTNFAATVSGDSIGRFLFNGNYSTSTSPAINQAGASLTTYATETWSGSAAGTRMVANITKTGTNTGLEIASLASDVAAFRSDSFTFQDSSSVNVVGNNINYNRVYGQWQNINLITPAASNTAYAFALPTIDFANIASVGSTSRIIPGAAGMYKLQFSVQVRNDDAAAEHFAYFWWRKNGTDVPNSMGQVGVTRATGGVDGLTIAGWDNMVSSANTTDYWELMYAVDDATHVDFPTFAATAFGPATAALFVTLVPIGA